MRYVPTVVALGAVVLGPYDVEPVPVKVYVADETSSPVTKPTVVTANVGALASVLRETLLAVTVRARGVISPYNTAVAI